MFPSIYKTTIQNTVAFVPPELLKPLPEVSQAIVKELSKKTLENFFTNGFAKVLPLVGKAAAPVFSFIVEGITAQSAGGLAEDNKVKKINWKNLLNDASRSGFNQLSNLSSKQANEYGLDSAVVLKNKKGNYAIYGLHKEDFRPIKIQINIKHEKVAFVATYKTPFHGTGAPPGKNGPDTPVPTVPPLPTVKIKLVDQLFGNDTKLRNEAIAFSTSGMNSSQQEKYLKKINQIKPDGSPAFPQEVSELYKTGISLWTIKGNVNAGRLVNGDINQIKETVTTWMRNNGYPETINGLKSTHDQLRTDAGSQFKVVIEALKTKTKVKKGAVNISIPDNMITNAPPRPVQDFFKEGENRWKKQVEERLEQLRRPPPVKVKTDDRNPVNVSTRSVIQYDKKKQQFEFASSYVDLGGGKALPRNLVLARLVLDTPLEGLTTGVGHEMWHIVLGGSLAPKSASRVLPGAPNGGFPLTAIDLQKTFPSEQRNLNGILMEQLNAGAWGAFNSVVSMPNWIETQPASLRRFLNRDHQQTNSRTNLNTRAGGIPPGSDYERHAWELAYGGFGSLSKGGTSVGGTDYIPSNQDALKPIGIRFKEMFKANPQAVGEIGDSLKGMLLWAAKIEKNLQNGEMPKPSPKEINISAPTTKLIIQTFILALQDMALTNPKTPAIPELINFYKSVLNTGEDGSPQIVKIKKDDANV